MQSRRRRFLLLSLSGRPKLSGFADLTCIVLMKHCFFAMFIGPSLLCQVYWAMRIPFRIYDNYSDYDGEIAAQVGFADWQSPYRVSGGASGLEWLQRLGDAYDRAPCGGIVFVVRGDARPVLGES